jgi:exopolysaccharide biosynthesis polyprenyl glycosylphosphotransferase
MQRAMAQYVPREMAVLGLVEVSLSFLVIYVILNVNGTPNWISGSLRSLTAPTAAAAAMLALGISVIALPIGLYQPEVCLDRRRLLPAAGLAAALICAALLLFGPPEGRLTLGHALETARLGAAGLATMVCVRLAWRLDIIRNRLVRRVLVLGAPNDAAAFTARLDSRRGRIFQPLATLADAEPTWPALRRRGVWGVVLASAVEPRMAEAILDCKLRGVPVLSAAAFQDRYLARIDIDSLTADGLINGDGFARGQGSALLKRLADIVLAITALLLALPLMTAAAVAIRLDSRGPVLYRQQRVGRFGTPFTMFKFRSMTADAEACGRPRWAQKHDPRITPVGRVIRASRIDELPQLVNVIRGEMSLVGPRPERPHFVEQLARAIPFYHQRAYVKPGLTGWAQVNYPYGASVEDAREKLAYDLYYVKHRTIWLDLVILLSTIRVVLFRDGAR